LKRQRQKNEEFRLFNHGNAGDAKDSAPLAERMRPRNISEYIGQRHLLAEGCLLKRAIEEDKLFP